jgi:hypothetical protein
MYTDNRDVILTYYVFIGFERELGQLSRYSDGLDGRGSIFAKISYFSLLHSVQTGSGAHTASYKSEPVFLP